MLGGASSRLDLERSVEKYVFVAWLGRCFLVVGFRFDLLAGLTAQEISERGGDPCQHQRHWRPWGAACL